MKTSPTTTAVAQRNTSSSPASGNCQPPAVLRSSPATLVGPCPRTRELTYSSSQSLEKAALICDGSAPTDTSLVDPTILGPTIESARSVAVIDPICVRANSASRCAPRRHGGELECK